VAEKSNTIMAITFKSVGHFLAKAFKVIVADLPKVIATAGTVEAVTAEIPALGVPVVAVESAAYAVLGEISALLATGGAAAEAKLANAGLDEKVVASVKELLLSIPTLVALAQAL
jgi:hypothetical protein